VTRISSIVRNVGPIVSRERSRLELAWIRQRGRVFVEASADDAVEREETAGRSLRGTDLWAW
jgi:hypothetical protein